MHVIATAGHVDHGKSTLIRALTGMEPDRWAEERRRGMTIDLGFAWTSLPSGEQVAFVDVPGHERFITNMLAGVGQVPAAILVVAADEGWRAQTSEHFEALQAFGVRHVVAAITRSDLADPQQAIDQTRSRFAAAGLDDPEVIAVSGTTGQNLPELCAALDRLVALLPDPDLAAAARLWVDRSFTIRGAGTVVTGTLVTGRLTVDDVVEIAPRGRTATIRGIESCRQPRSEVAALARVAVNLRGVAVDDVTRGDALIIPGSCTSASVVDIEASEELTAGHRMLHLGSSTTLCRVRPLGGQASRYCRLSLRSALPLRLNDHGILRDSAGRAAVGVVVRDLDPPVLRRHGAAAARAVELAQVVDRTTSDDIIRWRGWLHRADLAAFGTPSLDGSPRTAGDYLVAPKQWAAWREALDQLVSGSAEPVPREQALRVTGVPPGELLDALVATVDGIESDGASVRRRGLRRGLTPAALSALGEVEQRLSTAPFAPPDTAELMAIGLDGTTLAVAVAEGRLSRISADVYLLPDAVDQAVARLRALPEEFTVAEARDALGSSRRVTLPLLQHLDAARWTERTDDRHRRLTRRAGAADSR